MKKEFKEYLRRQAMLHPGCQPADVVKLCYQAAKGPEHILATLDDAEKAENYFISEYERALPDDGPLCEQISDRFVRVNFGAWKKTGMPMLWLLSAFYNSAYPVENGDELLENFLADADACVAEGAFGFPLDEWKSYMEEYRAAGKPSVHHSEAYRGAESPSYRLVITAFSELFPILQRLNAVWQKCNEEERPMVIAIDGRAGAGKTTFSRNLRRLLNGGAKALVQMDDFFLPKELRSEERLASAGGNIHYERFIEEVLPNIGKKEPFKYRYFDCCTMDYGGEERVESPTLRVVEGSYSHHPAFGEYANFKIFLDIDPEVQNERICCREVSYIAERFQNEWIPMEEHYFDTYRIREKADFVMRYEVF